MANGPLTNNADQLITKTATSASYFTSGGITVVSLLDFLNEYALAFGVILGVATFGVNLYYQRKHYRLAEAVSKASPPPDKFEA